MSTTRSTELAQFLRSCRARVGPVEVGLDPESARRRVTCDATPGFRPS